MLFSLEKSEKTLIYGCGVFGTLLDINWINTLSNKWSAAWCATACMDDTIISACSMLF